MEDTIAPLPLTRFTKRRASVVLSTKIIEKWAEKVEVNDTANLAELSDSRRPSINRIFKKPSNICMASFSEYNPDSDFLENGIFFGREDQPIMAPPSKITPDEMTELLYECINEESLRRECLVNVPPPKRGMRRGSIQIIKPEASHIEQEAAKLSELINKIVDLGLGWLSIFVLSLFD